MSLRFRYVTARVARRAAQPTVRPAISASLGLGLGPGAGAECEEPGGASAGPHFCLANVPANSIVTSVHPCLGHWGARYGNDVRSGLHRRVHNFR